MMRFKKYEGNPLIEDIKNLTEIAIMLADSTPKKVSQTKF